MGILIKKYLKSDFKALASLYLEFDRYNNSFDKKKKVYSIKEYEKYALDAYKRKGWIILIALDRKDKTPVGYVSGYKITQADEFFIDDLFVSKDYRKLGVGKMFLDKIKSISKGLNSITLQVYNWNKNAFPFYTSYGFEKESDVTIMTMSLKNKKSRE